MPTTHNAPFRYDIVGSFLRPDVLKQARADHAAGIIDAAALKTVEDVAIRDLEARHTAAGQLFGPTFRPHRTAAALKSSGRTHPVRPISGAGSAYDGNRAETARPKFVRHS